jgi:hypothetical protein
VRRRDDPSAARLRERPVEPNGGFRAATVSQRQPIRLKSDVRSTGCSKIILDDEIGEELKVMALGTLVTAGHSSRPSRFILT